MNSREINEYIATHLFKEKSLCTHRKNIKENYINNYLPVINWLCRVKGMSKLRINKNEKDEYVCSLSCIGGDEAANGKTYEIISSTVGEAICRVAVWYHKTIFSPKV